jgi:hypothetical protein
MQVPGTEGVRFTLVVLVAGLALLGMIGAAVMLLFWLDMRNGVVLPSQRDRAREMLDVLASTARVVGVAIGALTVGWTFVAVLNARLASGRRRNPIVAALAWPAAAVAIWMLDDRLTTDPSIAVTIAVLCAEAAVLYVPFLLIERAADAVEARRTPVRILYIFVVVLLIYTEALMTFTAVTDAATSREFGRLSGFLLLGAVVVLASTLVITEACRSIAMSTEYMADHHNALVEQRRNIESRAVRPEQAVSS